MGTETGVSAERNGELSRREWSDYVSACRGTQSGLVGSGLESTGVFFFVVVHFLQYLSQADRTGPQVKRVEEKGRGSFCLDFPTRLTTLECVGSGMVLWEPQRWCGDHKLMALR